MTATNDMASHIVQNQRTCVDYLQTALQTSAKSYPHSIKEHAAALAMSIDKLLDLEQHLEREHTLIQIATHGHTKGIDWIIQQAEHASRPRS